MRLAEAYGWPADLSDIDIVARLVALNKERARRVTPAAMRWVSS
jgi:hypothetical protein